VVLQEVPRDNEGIPASALTFYPTGYQYISEVPLAGLADTLSEMTARTADCSLVKLEFQRICIDLVFTGT
jgi:hypothetical protein